MPNYTTQNYITICQALHIPFGGSGYKGVDPVAGTIGRLANYNDNINSDAYTALVAECEGHTDPVLIATIKDLCSRFDAIAFNTGSLAGNVGDLSGVSYSFAEAREVLADRLRTILHYETYQTMLRKQSEGAPQGNAFVTILR